MRTHVVTLFLDLQKLKKRTNFKNPKRLKDVHEIELIKFIALWPRTLELAAKNMNLTEFVTT